MPCLSILTLLSLSTRPVSQGHCVKSEECVHTHKSFKMTEVLVTRPAGVESSDNCNYKYSASGKLCTTPFLFSKSSFSLSAGEKEMILYTTLVSSAEFHFTDEKTKAGQISRSTDDQYDSKTPVSKWTAHRNHLDPNIIPPWRPWHSYPPYPTMPEWTAWLFFRLWLQSNNNGDQLSRGLNVSSMPLLLSGS